MVFWHKELPALTLRDRKLLSSLMSLRGGRISRRSNLPLPTDFPAKWGLLLADRNDIHFMKSESLRLREHDHVEPVVVEEGVTHADLGVRIADQVQVVARIGLVVDPPVDDLLRG